MSNIGDDLDREVVEGEFPWNRLIGAEKDDAEYLQVCCELAGSKKRRLPCLDIDVGE